MDGPPIAVLMPAHCQAGIKGFQWNAYAEREKYVRNLSMLHTIAKIVKCNIIGLN